MQRSDVLRLTSGGNKYFTEKTQQVFFQFLRVLCILFLFFHFCLSLFHYIILHDYITSPEVRMLCHQSSVGETLDSAAAVTSDFFPPFLINTARNGCCCHLEGVKAIIQILTWIVYIQQPLKKKCIICVKTYD